MEAFLVYPAIALFFVVLIGGFCLKSRPLRGLAADKIERATKAFQGTFDPGHYFRKPRVRFEAHGCPGELTWRGSRGPDSEFLRIFAEVRLGPGVAGKLKIWSRSIPWQPRWDPPWNCPRVLLGDPALDAELEIRSSPPALAEELFAPDRRAQVASLARELVGDDALALSGGVLRVSLLNYSIQPGMIVSVVTQLRRFVGLLRESQRTS